MAKIHTSRRSFKAIGHIFVAFFCLAGLQIVQGNMVTAAGADIDSEYRDPRDGEYRDPNVPGGGYQIVILRDRGNNYTGSSYLTSKEFGVTCSSLSDDNCQADAGQLSYSALLPPCSTSSQLDCIAEFGAQAKDGSLHPATLVRYFPAVGRHDFVGDDSVFLPSGDRQSIWSIPSLGHDGGNNYLLQVNIRGSQIGQSAGGFWTDEFNVDINPIELVSNPNPNTAPFFPWREAVTQPGIYDFTDGELQYDENGNELPQLWRKRFSNRGSGDLYDCVIIADDLCARRHAFPVGAKLYLKVRLSSSPTGWLHGRISDPTVSITAIPGTKSGVEVSVAATAIKVPIVAIASARGSLPANLQDAYNQSGENSNSGGFKGSYGGWCPIREYDGYSVRNCVYWSHFQGKAAIEELLMWLPFINDTATANLSSWSIRSLSADELQGSGRCMNNTRQLNGLVMTNATKYSAGPPKFDKATGSLNYRVAAPHYTSGGNVFLGTYDLIMRSDVARCIYGFSNAPLNASISVIDNDGVTTTATKLVSEKDGWLRIAAYGFEFSSPTIKVKLTQGSKTAKQKMITISCKKGKAIKKVSGKNPKCSAGYKKMKT